MFLKDESEDLQGYANSDWARSLNNVNSISSYVFSFGSGVFFLEYKETRYNGSIQN